MTKNIFVRKKSDAKETGQSGQAQFFLATVASVTAAEGVTIIPDGQTEAVAKKYKVLTAGTAPPAVGDRVVVMRHSGTCVILGAIGEPEDMDADTRITDIENEITEIDTELGKKVAKAGDTMTGLLNINRANPGVIGKVTDKASSDTVATTTNSIGFRLNDKNGNLVAYYTDRYENTGENGALFGGYRMVNGTNTGNIIRLLLDAAGNKLVYVTSPAAWRKALGLGNASGAFPITAAQGGTGATSAAGHAVFAGPNSSTAAAPSFRALVAADIPNLDASKITAGTLPIGRGGTGSTGTATVTTLASIATAGPNVTLTSGSYYQWGKLAMIAIQGKSTAALANLSVLFTMVSGKRPANTSPAQIGNSASHSAIIKADGAAILGGSLSSGTEFVLFAVYLLP